MTRTHTRFTHRLSKLVVTPIRLSLLLALMLAPPAHSETVGNPAADSDAIKYEAIELVNRELGWNGNCCTRYTRRSRCSSLLPTTAASSPTP